MWRVRREVCSFARSRRSLCLLRLRTVESRTARGQGWSRDRTSLSQAPGYVTRQPSATCVCGWGGTLAVADVDVSIPIIHDMCIRLTQRSDIQIKVILQDFFFLYTYV